MDGNWLSIQHTAGSIPAAVAWRTSDMLQSYDQMIEVLRAAKAQKQIQFRQHGHNLWADCNATPRWNFATTEYREKPQPRVTYINDNSGFAYAREEDALRLSEVEGSTTLRFVEDMTYDAREARKNYQIGKN